MKTKKRRFFCGNPRLTLGVGVMSIFNILYLQRRTSLVGFRILLLKIVCKFRVEQNCPETKEKTHACISHLPTLLHASQKYQVDGLEDSSWEETVIGLPKPTAVQWPDFSPHAMVVYSLLANLAHHAL